MTSNCGKISLLLTVIIAMLVQNVYPTPTPSNELAAVDPFDKIPEELKVTGWKQEEVEYIGSKLTKLALVGLNKIRAANGVTGNLEVDVEYMQDWAILVSEHFSELLEEKDTNFTIPTENDPGALFFNKIFDYRKQGITEYLSTTVSISDLLVETIRNWYKKAQTDVKNGAKKESISVLDPDTKYMALGFNSRTVYADNRLKAGYYNCLILLATEAQLEVFRKEADKFKSP